MREHEYEPTPGLPEKLPPGEAILWQGAPDKTVFARHAYHLYGLAAYFGLMVAVRVGVDVSDGSSIYDSLADSWSLPLTAIAVIATLAAIGIYTAKASIYTITSRRVVLRVGLALPMTINIPFSTIGTMALRRYNDGTGDIVISLMPGNRIAWLALWPHCRTRKLAQPEPLLRCIPHADVAAQVLARALSAGAGQSVGTKPAAGVARFRPRGSAVAA